MKRENGMSTDYERGYKQFAEMVGEENIESLVSRFRSVCPDFEKEVVAVLAAGYGLEAVSISRPDHFVVFAYLLHWAATMR